MERDRFPKPKKPSNNIYAAREEEELTMARARLPKPKKPTNNIYAEHEADALTSGNFDSLRNISALRREEKLKDHSSRIMVFLFWVLASLLVVILAVWAWHLLLPDDDEWAWLEPEKIKQLQLILSTGSISALISGFVRKAFA